MFGGIEAGGTKFVCAVGDGGGGISEKITFPTTEPDEVIGRVRDFFKDKKIVGLGVGAFGPIQLNCEAENFGYITSTPKLKWQGYNLLGALKRAVDAPVRITTDVNVSLYGEICFGCAKGLKNAFYMTIGTGVGASAFVNGGFLHGYSHPEMGHVLVERNPDDRHESVCPYHYNCLEGLASGPALDSRVDGQPSGISEDSVLWSYEAEYIGKALATYFLTISPERMILGGGVMKQAHLFPRIREYMLKYLNGYSVDEKFINGINEYVVPPELGDDAGVIGAISLFNGNC